MNKEIKPLTYQQFINTGMSKTKDYNDYLKEFYSKVPKD